VLFLWAAKDDLEDLYGDPLEIWRDWAEDVRGRAIGCGHHIAEEAPDELAAELRDFFGQPSAEPPRRHPRRRKSPG
jgi:haloacetate dehalogenase